MDYLNGVFEILAGYLIIAFIIELIMEAIKPVTNKIGERFNLNGLFTLIVGLVIGVLICIGFGFDLFSEFIPESNIPYLGSILTGLIVGRGGTWLNTWLDEKRVLRSLKANREKAIIEQSNQPF